MRAVGLTKEEKSVCLANRTVIKDHLKCLVSLLFVGLYSTDVVM